MENQSIAKISGNPNPSLSLTPKSRHNSNQYHNEIFSRHILLRASKKIVEVEHTLVSLIVELWS